MKKKSIKSLTLNKEVISSFNHITIQGGMGKKSRQAGCEGNGGDTAQSFCGYATCGTQCEVQTASEQTVCCN
ncbi:hypothetical protein [uncultured Dokdonia sp.]|uniref:hypothetical protein n=1 Tax=uncultured Dokdonia sp. TaxID=575653 RepID=UPI002619B7CF|nr:hypothetical protein [uncultured Dokdonia sp.]